MRIYNKLMKSKKGSTILTVIIAMLVLSLLGIAVTTMSIGTLQKNVADSSNNDAYYGSESAINSAIEHVKHEIIAYYNEMGIVTMEQYSVLYNNFFSSIASNSQSEFVEPNFKDVDTVTTFYVGDHDAVNDIGEINIKSISTAADNSSYQVNAILKVKRVNIKSESGEFVIPDNAALIAGDLLNINKNSGFTVNGGGNAIVGDITYTSSWPPYSINGGGSLIIDPSVGGSIKDFLNYNSYTDPTITSPNAVASVDTSYNWSNIPSSPVSIISTGGSDIQVHNNTITDGVIHSSGDLHMNNGVYTVDLYVDGDVHINNSTINGDVYCRGVFYGNNAIINGNVVSETSVDWHNGRLNGSVYGENSVYIQDASGIGDVISNGPVEINRAGISGGLVYSPVLIRIGDCSVKAILYSCGDIEISKSMSMQGAMLAKNEIYYDRRNTWFSINYSPESVNEILENVDMSYFKSSGGSYQTLDSTVFVSTDIITVGRIN